jgi:hypothetical protein
MIMIKCRKLYGHTIGASAVLISWVPRCGWISRVGRYELNGAAFDGCGVASGSLRIWFVPILKCHAAVVARIRVDECSDGTSLLGALDLIGLLDMCM